MRAMIFDAPGQPLRLVERPDPEPGAGAGAGQLLIEVHTCGLCRTDLHIVDGEVEVPRPPVIPGHQIVGTVAGTDRRREAERLEPVPDVTGGLRQADRPGQDESDRCRSSRWIRATPVRPTTAAARATPSRIM